MVQVIPAINGVSFEEIKKKMQSAREFGADWVHIDVADGKFTPNLLWNKPKDLANQRPTTNDQRLSIEVHLMVENPDEALDDWLKAGVSRVIVHIEAAESVEKMKKKCEAFGVELALASNSDTSVEKLLQHKGHVDGFLVLAVNPGLAGQKFQESQLGKIRTLRQQAPDAKIEVDGGVNAEVSPKIKEAGANVLISASYIWGNKDPKEAYIRLTNI